MGRVNNGESADIPRVPARSQRRTRLRQRTLELLPESPRRTSIAVTRSACYPGQFIHRARPGSGGGFAVCARTNRAVHGRPGSELFDTIQIGLDTIQLWY